MVVAIIIVVGLQWQPSIRNTSHFRFPPLAKVAAYIHEVRNEDERVFKLTHHERNVLNYHLGSAVKVKVIPKIPLKLPNSFWLIYKPKFETERAKITWLHQIGFITLQSRSFKNANYFGKGEDDFWTMRVLFLSRKQNSKNLRAASR